MPDWPTPSPVGDASLVQCVGTSLTNGYGLGDTSLRASSRLAGLFGSAQEWNESIVGSVLGWDDTLTAGGISWLAQRLKRYRTKAPYAAASDVVLIQYGINDMINVGMTSIASVAPTAQGLAVFKNALRTAITLFRSAARFYAGDKTTNLNASITFNTAANWTAVANAAQPAGKRGSGAISGSVGYVTTTTNGSTGALSISIPGDYPGSAVCPLYVMFVTGGGLTAGTITASGAATGTFDLFQQVSAGVAGTYDSVKVAKNLCVWRFTGNAIAANTNGAAQTLTLTPSSVAGGPWGFAEWGIEAEVPPLICVLDINKCNPVTGFWTLVANTDITTWNAGILAIVQEFSQDSYTMYTPIDGTMNGAGKVGATTVGQTVTTASPANGGSLTLTSASGYPTSGAGMIDNGIGSEIVSWTGVSSNNLTGIQRAAYGTAAGAGTSGTTAFRQVTASAIKNFYTDGVHFTEDGQGIVTQTVAKAVSSLASDPAKNSYRAGPGRADVRCHLTSNLTQILFAGHSFDPLMFNEQVIDTAYMHDPGGGATGTDPGPNTKAFIKSDGLYLLEGAVGFTQGKYMTTGGTTTAGLRQLLFLKNGATNIGSQTTYATTADQNVFVTAQLTTSVIVELRAGDTISLCPIANSAANAGGNTTLNGAISTTSATSVVVTSGAAFVANDYVMVDQEVMSITSISTNTLTVVRGVLNTTAATHLTAAPIWSGVAVPSSGNIYSPMLSITRLQAI